MSIDEVLPSKTPEHYLRQNTIMPSSSGEL
jgi:hypothetical protein